MKKLFQILLLLLLPIVSIGQNIKGDNLKIKGPSRLIGQVVVGASTFNTSALLSMESTTQGLLIPRMTTAERLAIVSPSTGLMVYDTDLSSFQVFDGVWGSVGGGADGNGIYDGSNTVPSTTVATLTDNINFTGGNFGINITPSRKFISSDAAANPITAHRPVSTLSNGMFISLALNNTLNNVTDYATISAIIDGDAGDNVEATRDGILTLNTATGGTVTEKLRIDEDGDVSIGATEALAKLHTKGISGGLSFLVEDAATNDLFTVNSTGSVIVRENTTLGDKTGNLNKVRINKTDFSSNYTTEIEAQSGSGLPLRIIRAQSNIGFGVQLGFSLLNSASEVIDYGTINAVISDNTNGSEDGRIVFATIAAGVVAERARIDNIGNMGIGTGSAVPDARLEVEGVNATGTSDALLIEDNVGTDLLLVQNDGRIGIGTGTPATSAILDITTTTGAVLFPRMTTAQRDALTAVDGMVIFNTTLTKLQVFAGGGWVSLH